MLAGGAGIQASCLQPKPQRQNLNARTQVHLLRALNPKPQTPNPKWEDAGSSSSVMNPSLTWTASRLRCTRASKVRAPCFPTKPPFLSHLCRLTLKHPNHILSFPRIEAKLEPKGASICRRNPPRSSHTNISIFLGPHKQHPVAIPLGPKQTNTSLCLVDVCAS